VTTAEIEALYIKHADDFRLLLGAHKDGPVLAVFDRDTTLGYGAGGFCNQWLVSNIHAGAFCIPAVLAVAAMESAWRERLEKEYQVAYSHNYGSGWFPNPMTATNGHGHETLAEAICAEVKARAAEKRAEEKVPYPPDVTSADPRVMFPVKEIIRLADAVYELAAGVPALRSKVKDILHNLKIRKDTPS